MNYLFFRPVLNSPSCRGGCPLTVLLALTLLMACGEAVSNDAAVGRLVMDLQSQTQDHRYQLRDAILTLTGPMDAQFSSNEHAQLQVELPVGDYRLTLSGQWSLTRETPEGPAPIQAQLESENPQFFSVRPGAVTRISLRFQTVIAPVTLGTGTLSLGLTVQERNAQELVITELMPDPQSLPDAEGEWFEVANTGAQTVDLRGCQFTRGNGSFELLEDLSIAPGSLLTFANSSNPGFTPDFVYQGLVLPNAATLELTLSCQGLEVDRAVVDASVTRRSGVSLALSRDAFSPAANDAADNWCLGTADYGGDLGSPGQANAPCPN